MTLSEQQLFIVESLPNIGPVNARNLLEKFNSVEKVFNADLDELKEVTGVGNKIAQIIRNVIESEYSTDSHTNIMNSDDPQKSILNGKNVIKGKNKPKKGYMLREKGKNTGNDDK